MCRMILVLVLVLNKCLVQFFTTKIETCNFLEPSNDLTQTGCVKLQGVAQGGHWQVAMLIEATAIVKLLFPTLILSSHSDHHSLCVLFDQVMQAGKEFILSFRCAKVKT